MKLKLFQNIICFTFFAAMFISLSPRESLSAINEVQPLRFGTFALRNNDAAHNLIIFPNGTISANPNFLFFSDGQEGQYTVSGFPAATPLIINVTVNPLVYGGGGEQFTVSAPTVWPVSVVTDGSGNASFNVGATLSTSGTGTMYFNGGFNGTMMITVNY